MTLLVSYLTGEYTEVPVVTAAAHKYHSSTNNSNENKNFSYFFSHGFGNTGGHAGHASNMEQLQSASQRQDQANAVEGHVRHSCQMEEVNAAS